MIIIPYNKWLGFSPLFIEYGTDIWFGMNWKSVSQTGLRAVILGKSQHQRKQPWLILKKQSPLDGMHMCRYSSSINTTQSRMSSWLWDQTVHLNAKTCFQSIVIGMSFPSCISWTQRPSKYLYLKLSDAFCGRLCR